MYGINFPKLGIFLFPTRKMIDMQRLKQLQKNSGLTQKPFAESLGISQAKYSKMLSGTQKPTPGIELEIMKVYKVHPQWLSGELDSETPVYLDDFVPRTNYDKLMNEKLSLVQEVADLYRKLAEKTEEENKRLKNIEVVNAGQ